MTAREADARVAVDVKALQAAGRLERRGSGLPSSSTRHQRRATRIAFHYMRDAADADEAVQDAFIKAYMHLGTFREELPFEVWFTRILINGCLDRLKQRRRREKWIAPPALDPNGVERNPAEYLPARGPSPEDQLLSEERRRQLTEALLAVARAAAAGVHAESLRRPDVARSERDDRVERIDGARAFVPGHSTIAGVARSSAEGGPAGQEDEPCGSLIPCFARAISRRPRSSKPS